MVVLTTNIAASARFLHSPKYLLSSFAVSSRYIDQKASLLSSAMLEWRKVNLETRTAKSYGPRVIH